MNKFILGYEMLPAADYMHEDYPEVTALEGPHWWYESPGALTTLIYSEGAQIVTEIALDADDEVHTRQWKLTSDQL